MLAFHEICPSVTIAANTEVPMQTITLSEAALAVLRSRIATTDADVTPDNLEACRELVLAGIMVPLSTFAKGPESLFKFTDEGWQRRHEILNAVAPLP